uniref:Transposase n=1 Tax=Candidatus Kentrum eta TaxID=2126337 RepID=A0A450UFN2_9GAMM|nr:MAG: Transposase [Candidatus Kentron sp. H]VFJ93985.1 MAG: Transposase [Candidatus Kentron sp. H]VFJ99138.1 MAG: Transposase [Candidatus Kentron sp. H]
MILPPSVDEYISQNNVVRAIDAYVDTLDLSELGFSNTQPVTGAGQPAYDPAALMRLYLYGYIQGIRSSRKLECETCRNLEVIWLIKGFRPSYKTIADFRKNNTHSLKMVNRDFILLCKELSLFGGEEVAVDGSFFSGNASKGSIYTEKKLNKQIESLDKEIAVYQEAISKQDAADDREGRENSFEDEDLVEKLRLLQEKQAEKQTLKRHLKDSKEKQLSTIDKDAGLLSKRGQTIAGYNVQIAVDSKHNLIVAEEVTNDGNDTKQLAPMLEKAREILQSENLTGLADSGYYDGNQIKTCEEQNITVYVPIPDKSKKISEEGRFTRERFQYDTEQNCYICPQGNVLTQVGNPRRKNNKELIRYASKTSDCRGCPLRSQCLTDKARFRQISRWVDEDVVERHRARMEQNPDMMKKRAAIVEHPFGTLKHRAGINHFLMRGLEKCRAEFCLMTLVYNFSRVLKILGKDFIEGYCVQRLGNALKIFQYA